MEYRYIWKTFFEYLFYKIAKLNIKLTKPNRAIVSVSGVQMNIVINIIIFFYCILFPSKRGLTNYEILIYFIIFFIIDYFNVKIYEDRFAELDKRWGNETIKRKIIGYIIVILTIIFSFGLFFLNGCIFCRFKKF